MDFKKTLKELDGAYRYTRGQFATSYQKLQKARAAAEAQPDHSQSREEQEYRAMQAKLALRDAEEAFKETRTKEWGKYITYTKSLREKLEAELKEAQKFDPAQMDMVTIEFLKSGLATTSDLARMAQDYQENPTMLRFIRQNLEQMVEKSNDSKTVRACYDILNQCGTEDVEALETFDAFVAGGLKLAKADPITGEVPMSMAELSIVCSNGWDKIPGVVALYDEGDESED